MIGANRKTLIKIYIDDKSFCHGLPGSMYVRVGIDGRLFYAEGFEDETYVDLFELREFKSIRVQSRGIDSDEGGPLKTGEKYLHTIGRTKQVFGTTPAAVIVSCVKEEDGTPKIFPVFRRSARS